MTRTRKTDSSYQGDDKSTPDAKAPASSNLQVSPEPSRIENMTVETKEELAIGDLLIQAEVETDRDEDHQVLQIEEVARPGGGLVLRH